MCKTLDFQKGPCGRKLTGSFVKTAMIENINENKGNS